MQAYGMIKSRVKSLRTLCTELLAKSSAHAKNRLPLVIVDPSYTDELHP